VRLSEHGKFVHYCRWHPHAIADRLLVNIQSNVIHMSFEEPPWLFSESTFVLSSVFVHHALLLGLAFKQSVGEEIHGDCCKSARARYLLPISWTARHA
jgi:hypothetical protein